MILNLQITDLISRALLLDWNIDNIHLNSKLVNRMHNMKEGRMKRMRFY